MPHWGTDADQRSAGFLVVAVPDGLAGLAAMATVASATSPRDRLAVVAGMVGAALPDLDKPGRLFFGRSPYPARFDAFHSWVQRESPRRMPQELLVIAALALAVRASRRPSRGPSQD